MTTETLSFGVAVPFVDLLGCKLTRFENGHAEVQLVTRPELLNSFSAYKRQLDTSEWAVMGMCWVGATTQRATARKAEQRPQRAPGRLSRACSDVTQQVKAFGGKKLNVHGHLQRKLSGQLPFIGSVTHGGVLMTLLDVAMASAARSVCPDMGAVTIEMKTSFMRPTMPSNTLPLLAKGELLHRSATMAFTQASVLDAHGQVCAHATGTFKYMKRLATSVRSVSPVQIAKD